MKTQWGFTIKSWCIDGGKEYGVNNLKALATDLGMLVETMMPYTPEQDGVSERSICTIIERLRSVMIAGILMF